MNLKFVDILNCISMFQLVLFIAFLINRSKNRVSNIILTAFFVSQLLGISNHFILSQRDFFLTISPHIFYIGLPFTWLWAPFFYLYVKSLFFSDFRLKYKHLLHSIPFLFFLLFSIFNFHVLGFDEKTLLIKSNSIITPQSALLVNILIAIQIAIYIIAAIVMKFNYKNKLKNRQSTINRNQSAWLNIFIYGYLVAFLITNICRAGLYVYGDLRDFYVFISFLSFFIYFILLFYKAISNPDIFIKTEEKPDIKTNIIPKQEAYNLLQTLNDYMTYQEPYLNPELSLKQLASEVKIPERLLSGIINQYKNQNFYDFVNNYRIGKAKKLLVDDQSNKNIQEILYDSGFNSKSTFNLAFKKHTGLTPSEFKKTTDSNYS